MCESIVSLNEGLDEKLNNKVGLVGNIFQFSPYKKKERGGSAGRSDKSAHRVNIPTCHDRYGIFAYQLDGDIYRRGMSNNAKCPDCARGFSHKLSGRRVDTSN